MMEVGRMFVMVPLSSVVYILIGEFINGRVVVKNLKNTKISTK